MAKVDLKKEMKNLYSASRKKVDIVEVPEMNFIMTDGQGDPNNSEAFQKAIETLYSISFTVKFMLKKGPSAVDFTVMPLEGLWWMDGAFDVYNKDKWKWALMIMQPEYVTYQFFSEAVEQVKKKKDASALAEVRFENFDEGLAAQILHVGPYSKEGPTIEMLHKFVEDNGYQLRGKHHEIYLGDPRKAAPEKLKTIIRHPVKK